MIRVAAVMLASVVVANVPLAAQTVVTGSDPQGWGAYTYGTSTPEPYGAFSSAYPYLGNGSAEIRLYDQGVTEVLWWMDLPTTAPLADLNQLSFDWYVSSVSTTPAWTTPAFGMYLTFGGGGGYIIWEGAYNGTSPAAPQDVWVSSNIIDDNFWWNGPGTGACANAASYHTLAWFNTECFGGDAQVSALAPFLGYGYAGTEFSGAFDNVAYAFDNGPSGHFNFEADASSTVPEPATMTLLATGLMGMAAARRRKRNS